MKYQWLKISQSFIKGVAVINQFDEEKFEQLLRRIVTKLKTQDHKIFTDDEILKLVKIFKVDEESLHLALKTLIYLLKRAMKFIFMPLDLKTNLCEVGIHNEKADEILKVWSMETKHLLDSLGTEVYNDISNSLDFEWNINAELSSDYHKVCKIPKACVTWTTKTDKLGLELTHPEIYSMYLQFEHIQNELDNFM